MILTKVEVARRQIDVAIRMYFQQGDEVSIHTLAASGRNVLVDLCRRKGLEPPMLLDTMIKTFIRAEHQKAVRDKAREAENFFKHADRDPANEFDFPVGSTSFKLFEGVDAFQALTGDVTAEMKVFRAWWLIQNEDAVSDEAPQPFKDALAGVEFKDDERQTFFTQLMHAQGAH
jgi:hypothetical protein